MISLLKQELNYHPNPVKLNLQLYVLSQVRLSSIPTVQVLNSLQSACHFVTYNYILNKPKKGKDKGTRETHLAVVSCLALYAHKLDWKEVMYNQRKSH